MRLNYDKQAISTPKVSVPLGYQKLARTSESLKYETSPFRPNLDFCQDKSLDSDFPRSKKEVK